MFYVGVNYYQYYMERDEEGYGGGRYRIWVKITRSDGRKIPVGYPTVPLGIG